VQAHSSNIWAGCLVSASMHVMQCKTLLLQRAEVSSDCDAVSSTHGTLSRGTLLLPLQQTMSTCVAIFVATPSACSTDTCNTSPITDTLLELAAKSSGQWLEDGAAILSPPCLLLR
jgi:hypothetical protein